MQGLGYVLSRDLVDTLARNAPSLRVYTNEASRPESSPDTCVSTLPAPALLSLHTADGAPVCDVYLHRT